MGSIVANSSQRKTENANEVNKRKRANRETKDNWFVYVFVSIRIKKGGVRSEKANGSGVKNKGPRLKPTVKV